MQAYHYYPKILAIPVQENKYLTEKNDQTKANDQKSSLFKSELNEVLKTLKMLINSKRFIKN